MTKPINTDKIVGTVINNNVVILQANSGVTIEADDAKNFVKEIEKTVQGEFGIVVDRVNDYAVSPVGVYSYLNSLTKLKVIGIVVYREVSLTVSDIETSFSDKPIQVFNTVDEATAWVESFFFRMISDERELVG